MEIQFEAVVTFCQFDIMQIGSDVSVSDLRFATTAQCTRLVWLVLSTAEQTNEGKKLTENFGAFKLMLMAIPDANKLYCSFYRRQTNLFVFALLSFDSLCGWRFLRT